MKSKTSLFNRTIFKKNVTHYWPAWALYLAYLLLAMPYIMWQNLHNYAYLDDTNLAERGFYAMRSVVQIGMLVPVIFVAATVMAMLVFSYLYTAKNANMIHALPVTRRELFITNYLFGLVFLLVPQIVTFLVTVMVALASNVTCIQYAFYGMLYTAGMTFFFYSLAVFVAMFTGQVLALGAYSFILNLLYVGCVLLAESFQSMVSYGASGSIAIGNSAVLSPLYYLIQNVGINIDYDDVTGKVSGITMFGGKAVLIYALVAIVFVLAAYLLYQRRQIETAGDLISINIIKPIFRWGVAICGGFTLAMLFASSTNQYKINHIYMLIMIGVVVFGTVCFFAAEMLLEKNFRVFKKKRIIECGVMCVLSFMAILLFKVDAFGIERYQPKAEEIAKAFVYMDYPMEIEEEDIPAVLDLQKEIIKNKNTYLDLAASMDSGYYYTSFRYYLKDGTCYTRRYPVPTTEEYLADENSPAAWILAYEENAERLMRNIIGMNYEENIYYSANMDLPVEDDSYQNIRFGSEEAEKLANALLKDIEEGNMTELYCYAKHGETITYDSTIYLNFVNANGNLDTWSYYNNYFRYSDIKPANGNLQEEYAMSSDTSVYIRFSPECTNLLAVLAEMGIEEDDLMRGDE